MSVAPPEHASPDVDLDSAAKEQTDRPWVTIVWNDPVNLMSYVAWVFRTYFGYSEAKAEKLMLAVHQEGKAVVSSGPRERMETDTEAMQGYGLWATFEKDT
ncbi:ATP-dependent Clp protease adapter ClpS [Flexivirga caeni]|uniref:ATP-dependent Clp protease adapter protein ClpS n=1 Tax=Flexivirga caeni TaxID=2294115 RepID=A0A3M9MDN5_9MICO|nr:ATP-dependent Clp protease adapter ClpS [Flexivirga caeni]RNI23315.1 ATP-dependent Clp protease adapter ClpS [Flexivirga caeni]